MGTIPDWFWAAVETPFEEGVVEVDECDVRWQAWGAAGAREDLLLVHGMFAHAHWWDFIAPALAVDRRVAALDLTGMGDSDYRYEYDADTWSDELRAVADAAGLRAGAVIVGHSFGGRIGLHTGVRHADRFGALVLADAGVRDPEEEVSDRPPIGGRPVLYPDAETARNRFRLQPPQPCENEFLVEYIARTSVLHVDDGWAFKFDTDVLTSMSGVAHEDAARDLQALELPLAVLYGAESELFSGRTLEHMRTLSARDFPARGLEQARHHLFLDRPLEFVEALEALLEELSAPRGPERSEA